MNTITNQIDTIMNDLNATPAEKAVARAIIKTYHNDETAIIEKLPPGRHCFHDSDELKQHIRGINHGTR